jgi:hypothetical protein
MNISMWEQLQVSLLCLSRGLEVLGVALWVPFTILRLLFPCGNNSRFRCQDQYVGYASGAAGIVRAGLSRG